MKRKFIAAVVFALFATTTTMFAINGIINASSIHSAIYGDWMKKDDGTWAGKMEGKKYWYKLDDKAKLWWSTDGKAWASVDNQMWADKDGKWMKIVDMKLMWSADKGKTWGEVPEWKWQGPDGEWYKFDSNWGLWQNK
jgi:hypothetical protein